MIRQLQGSDVEVVLDIWLRATIEAHEFVAASVWASQLDNMRQLYCEAAQTWVYDRDGEVLGFYALSDGHQVALFVDPQAQGEGICKELIAHAKSRRENLTLTVCQENWPCCAFYLSQGFRIVSEQREPHTGRMEYAMSLGG